jgi:cardiolipin synthase
MARFEPRQLLSPANLLTLSRLPMAALVWVAPASLAWVGAWLALAALTDLLDGWVARRQGVPGEDLGAWLDPLCDKVFVVSTLVAVWAAFGLPWWLAALAATRELVLFPLVVARFAVPRLRERHLPWKAKALGKATTVAQFALFASVLLRLEGLRLPLALAAAVLGLGAGVQYTLRAAKRWSAPSPPPPPG